MAKQISDVPSLAPPRAIPANLFTTRSNTFVWIALLLVALAILRSAISTRLDGFTIDEPYHIAAAASDLYWRGINGIYGGKPDDAEAEKTFRRSVELDPTAYFVHIQLGNLYLKSRSREKCVRAYSEALKYAPEDPEIRSALQNQIQRVSREDLGEVNPLRDPYME